MTDLSSPLHPDTPIVVFGDDWGRHVSTMQHIFRHVAPRHPVVWINGIGHRLPGLNAKDLHRAWTKIRSSLRGSVDLRGAADLGGSHPLVVVAPRVLPWHNLSPVHSLNNNVLLRTIRHHLASNGLHRRPLLVTGSPPAVGVIHKSLNEIGSIYFCMDDFLHHPDATGRVMAPLEARLLQQVDAVVATAKSLTVSKMPASGRAYHLPQGVNYDHFATERSEPADLAGIPRPRIGFAGGINFCCDFALIADLARTMPGCSVVLVGPILVDDAVLQEIKLPNVHLLGPRPYRDLPAYVQQFQVAIVPYVLNDWTRAVDPLKLLEYLAAGKPVVSTNIPESLKYAPPVRVADSHDHFIASVGRALLEDPRTAAAAGQEVAKSHTWNRRAQELLDIVESVFA